ncbi:MAG: UDP-glucose 4-epimerase GalE [Nitrococcus mobilis]|nr:UDP-glucose 4-epimerase GalE [Nitrococcus mobilis]
MKILVTGGAGYIGSHVVRQLIAADHEVIVYDNLSTGHRWAVADAPLVEGDLAEREKLSQLMEHSRFEALIHFAASTVVPESLAIPLAYYANNTRNTLGLLELIDRYRLPWYVFSSTAAVYGLPAGPVVTEEAPLAPINPYGASKMMSERICQDLAAASELRYVILRYFNVAGAEPEARIGQATPQATHLIKVACEAVVGARSGLKLYGTDYPTADGTCIRDYIHVEDLARAHVMALEYLAAGGASEVLNCGYGHGYSVREVLDRVQAVAGVPFPVEEVGRRPGDPPALVADNTRIRRVLGWQPVYDDLERIVAHAVAWERAYQAMRQGG